MTAEDKMTTNQSLLQKTGKTQAAFVPKLFIMVQNMKQPTPEDPNPKQPLISWSKAGDVFCVFDPIEFSRVILPLHFKHNNWQSFVRQLNMYGFHKVNDLLSSSHCQTDTVQAWEFRHPFFKQNRPDLLPMIKRKSTKHHGSSKASNTGANAQATTQVGEIHLQRQMPSHDSTSGRATRAFQACMPHHQTSPISPSTHHPLHGKAPPPPALPTGKAPLPPRAPTLYPILTHQFQYTHSTHSQLKSSSPLLKHLSTQASPTTRPNQKNNGFIQFSPSSARHPTTVDGSITNHSHHSRRSHMQEEELTERSFAWSSVREPCNGSSSLSSIENQLRRLNDTLTDRDPKGNHIFSVLRLISELLTLLVDNQEGNVAPLQQEKLSRYVQTAREALGKLEASYYSQQDSIRRCSGAPSTDSLSPISTDHLERSTLQRADRCRNSVDSNLHQTNDRSSSTGWIVRPRCFDRVNSSQSLPPLNTMMTQCAPAIYKRTHSPGALPASINRLMNTDVEEYPKMAVSSEEDAQDQERVEEESEGLCDDESCEEEKEEREGEEDDLDDDDHDSAGYDEQDTGDNEEDEGRCGRESENYGDVNELANCESGSEESFSDQLSSSAASTSGRAVQREGPKLQLVPQQNEPSNLVHPKRPHYGSATTEEPPEGGSEISSLQDTHSTNRRRKRMRSNQGPPGPASA